MVDGIPGAFWPAVKIGPVPVRNILTACHIKCRTGVSRFFECRNTGKTH